MVCRRISLSIGINVNVLSDMFHLQSNCLAMEYHHIFVFWWDDNSSLSVVVPVSIPVMIVYVILACNWENDGERHAFWKTSKNKFRFEVPKIHRCCAYIYIYAPVEYVEYIYIYIYLLFIYYIYIYICRINIHIYIYIYVEWTMSNMYHDWY